MYCVWVYEAQADAIRSYEVAVEARRKHLLDW